MMVQSIVHYGLGRRKRAVARVYVRCYNYNIVFVNGLTAQAYFKHDVYLGCIRKPMCLAGINLQVKANVKGGGKSSQARAISLGVARALMFLTPHLKPLFTAEHLLTRDPREVERKKPGLHKARKNKQFSKR